MSCPALQYSNVAASAWQCCKNAVSAYVTITTDQGQAESNGVTISWNYNAAAQTLSLQCLDKPFIVSCDFVNGRIEAAGKV